LELGRIVELARCRGCVELVVGARVPDEERQTAGDLVSGQLLELTGDLSRRDPGELVEEVGGLEDARQKPLHAGGEVFFHHAGVEELLQLRSLGRRDRMTESERADAIDELRFASRRCDGRWHAR
jgi:hypothetical protein